MTQKLFVETKLVCQACGGELKHVLSISFPELSLFKCVACGTEVAI